MWIWRCSGPEFAPTTPTQDSSQLWNVNVHSVPNCSLSRVPECWNWSSSRLMLHHGGYISINLFVSHIYIFSRFRKTYVHSLSPPKNKIVTRRFKQPEFSVISRLGRIILRLGQSVSVDEAFNPVFVTFLVKVICWLYDMHRGWPFLIVFKGWSIVVFWWAFVPSQ